MIKKSIAVMICTVLLSGCRNAVPVLSENESNSSSVTAASAALSEKDPIEDRITEHKNSEMFIPQFEILSEKSLIITSKLRNVSEVKIYICETSSENSGKVLQKLVYRSDIKDLNKSETGYEIQFDPDKNLSESTYKTDNSKVKTEYYAKGIRVGFYDGSSELISSCVPIEVHIETGTVNQYDAALRGDTACGAASGTLLLQSVLPVWDHELTTRMSEIRDYSALSPDYSVGSDNNYYMSGEQIANSVNKYLKDIGADDISITDFRSEQTTEETLIELLCTARPAVLEVCYSNGEILSDYDGFSHWITVNGFRLKDGGYEFRWENTIGCTQNWVSSEQLENGNKNVTYNSVDFQPTRYIAALSEVVTNSII